MTRMSILSLFVVGLLSPVAASAADVGVGVSVGTTGASVEASLALGERVAVRGGYNYLEFSGGLESDGIDYDGDATLSTFGAFADIAPFGTAFVVSGGAYVGPKDIDLVATPSTAVTIGGMTFSPEEVGSLSGQAELADFAPYAGIGYDNFLSTQGKWSVSARAGVMFTGSADVTLDSADGLLSKDPVLLQELRAEAESIEEDAEGYEYYPVVTLGVTRRF